MSSSTRSIMSQIGSGTWIAGKIVLTAILLALSLTTFVGFMMAPDVIRSIWGSSSDDDE